MSDIRHIIITDELHPTHIVTLVSTPTFIGMIASISHIMYLHISRLYCHNGEAVRARSGTLSFALPRIYSSRDDTIGIALD
jgi:hypothetical protein